MQIKLEQLQSTLTHKLASCYWIAGDEHLLVDDAFRRIVYHAKKQGFCDTIKFDATQGIDWHNFRNDYQTQSLFSTQQILVIQLGNRKLADAGRKILTPLLAAPNPDKLVIILSEKLDQATQKTKWFQSITQHSIFIPVYALQGQSYILWLEKETNRRKLSVDTQALRLLAEMTTGNPLAARQILAKLSLNPDKSLISTSTLQQHLSDHAQFDIFKLSDTILANQPKQLCRVICQLQQSSEITLALWAISRLIRQLIALKAAQEQHTPLSTVFKKERIFSTQQSLFNRALNRFSSSQLKQALQQGHHIDKQSKGFVSNQNALPVWQQLEQCALTLMGYKKP